MRVYVTQSDIDNGKRGDCQRCPVYLGVKRGFPNYYVAVRGSEIEIQREWECDLEVIPLPYEASEFVKNFDLDPLHRERPVKPFHFDIRVPVNL